MIDESFVQARRSMKHLLSRDGAQSLHARLLDESWYELLADHESLAINSLFGAQGELASAETAVDLLLLSRLPSGSDPAHSVVVYPGPASSASAAAVGDPDGVMHVAGVAHALPERPAAAVILAATAEGERGLIEVPMADLPVVSRSTWDPARTLLVTRAGLSRDVNFQEYDWLPAVNTARRALAQELVSTAEAMLGMAIAHTSERSQFGVPLASFQSVRHRLVDVHVAVRSTQALVDSACATGDEYRTFAAKAQAGKTALLAVEHCQQVCGAMGWTWEFGLHRFTRRAVLLDALLGSADALHQSIGRSACLAAV